MTSSTGLRGQWEIEPLATSRGSVNPCGQVAVALDGRPAERLIAVPGRLVNFVV